MELRIISSSGEKLSVAADYVLLPGKTGQLGILPGHAGMTALLGQGLVRYESGEEDKGFSISGGVAEVAGDKILILI